MVLLLLNEKEENLTPIRRKCAREVSFPGTPLFSSAHYKFRKINREQRVQTNLNKPSLDQHKTPSWNNRELDMETRMNNPKQNSRSLKTYNGEVMQQITGNTKLQPPRRQKKSRNSARDVRYSYPSVNIIFHILSAFDVS